MCGYNSRSERSLRHNDEEVTEKTWGDLAADPDVCRKLALGPELSDRVLGLTWKVALGGRATQGHRIVTGSLLPQARESHFHAQSGVPWTHLFSRNFCFKCFHLQCPCYLLTDRLAFREVTQY